MRDAISTLLLGTFPDASSVAPLVFGDKPYSLPWHNVTSPQKGWSALTSSAQGSINARGFFNRCKSHHGRWDGNRILPFLRLSIHDVIPFDNSMSIALIAFWQPVYNCFFLPDCLKTITLCDIALMTSLAPVGVPQNYFVLTKYVTASAE